MEKEEIINTIQASIKVCAENVKARHWMMTGHDFMTYHPYFDEINEKLIDFVDEIAESTVVMGGIPPYNFEQYLKFSFIEPVKIISSLDVMLNDTIEELNKIYEYINTQFNEKAFDDTTADLMVKITRKIRDKFLFFLKESTRHSFL